MLAAGAEATWSGKWNVTQSQLDAGKITFKIRYALYSDEGELVNKEKAFSRAITYAGEEPAVEVRRTIAPTTARKGQEVSVTYEVANTGNVEVTNVVIKENNAVSTKSGKIDSIPAGEKKTYTFTTKMGTKNITSAATVTYKAGGQELHREEGKRLHQVRRGQAERDAQGGQKGRRGGRHRQADADAQKYRQGGLSQRLRDGRDAGRGVLLPERGGGQNPRADQGADDHRFDGSCLYRQGRGQHGRLGGNRDLPRAPDRDQRGQKAQPGRRGRG